MHTLLLLPCATAFGLAVLLTAPSPAPADDTASPTPQADVDAAFGITGKPGLGTIADPSLALALLADPNLIADPDTALLFAPDAQATKATIGVAPTGNRLDLKLDPSTRWLRLVSGTGAGQVAAVAEVAPDHVRIGRVFDLPPRFVAASPREPGWLDALLAGPSTRTGDDPWFRRPAAGDRIVAVTSSLLLDGTTPAVVTVSELLADGRLRALNVERVQPRLDAIKAGRRNVGFLSLPVLFTEHDGRIVPLTPNLADVRVVDGRHLLPRPWGPRGPDGRDVFEDATREAFAGEEIDVSFVDDAHAPATPAPWWTRLRRP